MQTINLQMKKTPANNKTKKSFQDWELSNKLFLITRKTTKIILLLIICWQIPKITLSGAFIDSWLGKLGKKVVTDLAIYFTKNNFSELVTNLTSNAASNAKNKFERTISGKGAARAGKVRSLCLFRLKT